MTRTTIHLCLSLIAFLLIFEGAYSQTSSKSLRTRDFLNCEKSTIDECVAMFVSNRDLFVKYACKGGVVKEQIGFHSKVEDSTSGTQFCIFEDFHSRSQRRDWREISMSDEDVSFLPWYTNVRTKGVEILSYRGIDMDPKKTGFDVDKNLGFVPNDLWCLSITDYSCLSLATGLRWMEIMDDRKLISSQESGSIVRAEWAFGKTGASRIDIYFDRDKGTMPVYCRYFVPKDKNVLYSRDCKIYENEIVTDWKRHDKGWVPTKIRNYRENISQKEGVLLGVSTTIDVVWAESSVDTSRLLDHHAVTPIEFYESFR